MQGEEPRSDNHRIIGLERVRREEGLETLYEEIQANQEEKDNYTPHVQPISDDEEVNDVALVVDTTTFR
jgi:hypothetical protein